MIFEKIVMYTLALWAGSVCGVPVANTNLKSYTKSNYENYPSEHTYDGDNSKYHGAMYGNMGSEYRRHGHEGHGYPGYGYEGQYGYDGYGYHQGGYGHHHHGYSGYGDHGHGHGGHDGYGYNHYDPHKHYYHHHNHHHRRYYNAYNRKYYDYPQSTVILV